MSFPSAQLSVIVPVFNGIPFLISQMEALSKQELDIPWEIIYADNGSTDGSREIISAAASISRVPIRLVDAAQQKGQAHARNAGAAAAKGQSLVFTDQDDLPQPGWLKAISEALSHSDAVGGYVHVTAAGSSPTKSEIKPADHLPILVGRFRTALGTNFAIRRNVFLAIGGWEDIGVSAGEDVDLCALLEYGGYCLFYASTAVVIWRSRDNICGVFRQGYKYGRADVILYKRHCKNTTVQRKSREALKTWTRVLFGMVKFSVGKAKFLPVVHRFAWAWGRTIESIRQRTLFI